MSYTENSFINVTLGTGCIEFYQTIRFAPIQKVFDMRLVAKNIDDEFKLKLSVIFQAWRRMMAVGIQEALSVHFRADKFLSGLLQRADRREASFY